MRILLDTHAVLWAAREPAKLSEQARRAIQLRANERIISAASVWEMGIKFGKGKLPEAEPLLGDLAGLLTSLDATLLPILGGHAVKAPQLEWEHADPFDRMLAAQSLIEQAPLVSVDHQFDRVNGLARLW